MNTSRKDYHKTGINKTAQRFLSARGSNTGLDPSGCLREFIQKDVKKNIDVRRDTVKRTESYENFRMKPAVGCTKKLMSQAVISNKPPVKYHLETDHISFKTTDTVKARPFQTVVHSMITNPRYSKSHVSSDGWLPKRTVSQLYNCQSTSYNIINHNDQQNANIRKTTNIDARRFKGITEIMDKRNVYFPNYNPDYQQAMVQEPRVFYRKTGIFSHMYDASARQGNITMPFEKNQDHGGKPAFKC